MGNDLVVAEQVALATWVAELDSKDKDYELAMEIGENRADGEKERDIARRLGVKRGQLRMWLKAIPERWDAFCAGFEARSDELVDETIEISDAATPEDVQVATLRVKARQWYAERASKGRWGSQASSSQVAIGNITIIHESR